MSTAYTWTLAARSSFPLGHFVDRFTQAFGSVFLLAVTKLSRSPVPQYQCVELCGVPCVSHCGVCVCVLTVRVLELPRGQECVGLGLLPVGRIVHIMQKERNNSGLNLGWKWRSGSLTLLYLCLCVSVSLFLFLFFLYSLALAMHCCPMWCV